MGAGGGELRDSFNQKVIWDTEELDSKSQEQSGTSES